MPCSLSATPCSFGRASFWAIAGESLGFLLWQPNILGIGAGRFGMGMSKTWTGREATSRFAMTVLGVLIHVALLQRGA